MIIKSVRSTIPLSTNIQPFSIGEVMDYQNSFFEVISILNFYVEEKEKNWFLIIDYVCQNLKYMSDKKVKSVERLSPVLHPFKVSFDYDDQDAYEKFRLGRGFHHRGRYFQVLRYTDIEREGKRISASFEALPIEPLPQYHVRSRLKKEKKSRMKVIELNSHEIR
ncbi:hypothetical protein [Bacillus sp. FJAT-47783]|uniref:hypothetical protein n=1 Tax=Bacillus sp. FJAT-47783 TaxID=2922712 RepID=UPI001FAB8B37|nr:hypothetical protein [Bacillus sp. FJAT-47783]